MTRSGTKQITPAADPLDMCIDREAESVFVGCALIGKPWRRWMAQAEAIVTSASWLADRKLSAIYRELLDVYHRDDTATEWDLVMLVGHLRDRGTLAECGGVAGIEAVVNTVASAWLLEQHAKRVREMHFRREILRCFDRGYHALIEPLENLFFDEAARWLGKMQKIVEMRPTDTTTHLSSVLPQIATSERSLCKCGISWIDNAIGLARGEYVIVAGRPSMGKSSLASQISIEAAKRGTPVLIISQEMPPISWATNLLARESGVSGATIRGRETDDDDADKMLAAEGRLRDLPLHMLVKDARSIAEVVGTAKRMVSSHGIGLVVVDYIQNIPSGRSGKYANENDELTYISRELQSLARNDNVCVLAVSQLNRRQGEGDKGYREPPPALGRLRGSGSIEQDADVVLFVHRPEHYARGGLVPSDLCGVAQLLCEKNRNGPTSMCWFTWQAECFRFRELSRDAWPAADAPAESQTQPIC